MVDVGGSIKSSGKGWGMVVLNVVTESTGSESSAVESNESFKARFSGSKVILMWCTAPASSSPDLMKEVSVVVS